MAKEKNTNLESYLNFVMLGRKAVERQSRDNWRIGELAAQVETAYGEAKLEKYADDIGIDYSVLKHCRTTYIAWSQKAGCTAFWTANVLNPHPDRFKIFETNPKITQKQARETMQAWRVKQNAAEYQEKLNERKKYLKDDDYNLPPLSEEEYERTKQELKDGTYFRNETRRVLGLMESRLDLTLLEKIKQCERELVAIIKVVNGSTADADVICEIASHIIALASGIQRKLKCQPGEKNVREAR